MGEWAITSSILIAVILLVRRIFRGRIRPGLQYALWLLAAVRLLCPVMIGDSSFSVLNLTSSFAPVQEQSVSQTVKHETNHTYDFEAGGVQGTDENTAVSGDQNKGNAADNAESVTLPGESVTTKQYLQETSNAEHSLGLKTLLIRIWLTGCAFPAAVILLINLRFWFRLRRVRQSVDMDGRPHAYEVELLQTPCLYGLFCPAIYLPASLKEIPEHYKYALVHERTHFQHGDHIWSLLRTCCLILHWYNPLVWAAYVFSRRDSELACDAGVIRRLGEEYRLDYGRALIAMTVEHIEPREFLCCATSLSSGKKEMKERIRLISKKKNWMIIPAVTVGLITVAAAAALFTGGQKPDAAADGTIAGKTGTTAGEDGTIAGADGTIAGEDGTIAGETGTTAGEDGTIAGETGTTAGANTEITAEVAADLAKVVNVDGREYQSNVVQPYTIIENPVIENEYFTMTVPEDFVGAVGYEIVETVPGELRIIDDYTCMEIYFYVDHMTQMDDSGEMDRSAGMLGGVEWRGLLEYGTMGWFDSLYSRAGELSFSKMDQLQRDYSFGYEGDAVDINPADTGAYCAIHPTDIQNPDEDALAYTHYDEELQAALTESFQAAEYPYNELEGYQEVLPDFLHAAEAVSWFGSYNQIGVDTEADQWIWTADGKLYYLPVVQYGIQTMTDLDIYLSRYLTPEQVSFLLDVRNPSKGNSGYPAMKEIDGRLYAAAGIVGNMNYAECNNGYRIEMSADGSEADVYVLQNIPYVNDNYITLDYHMVHQEDGWFVEGDFTLPVERTMAVYQAMSADMQQ